MVSTEHRDAPPIQAQETVSVEGTGLPGLVRRGLRRLTTPLLPDDYSKLVNPLWSRRELRGRIVSVTPEADDVVSLVIDPGWGVPVEFHPGQYIGIGVHINARYVWRSYSLTSPPRPAGGQLGITVKARDGGQLSNHLVSYAQPGMMVRLAAPAGDFHLPEPVPAKLLFVTAGSGITPVMSMLRTLGRASTESTFPDVVHLHSARTRDDVLFAGELSTLAQRSPQYQLHLRLTRHEGRLSPADLAQSVPDWRDREAFVCGPSEMLDQLEDFWAAQGDPQRIHTERFLLDRSTTDAEGGTVTFGPGRGSVEVDGATTLLEAGESIGIQMPYGCRMGICATCVRPLSDGVVRDLRTGLTHESGDRIRTCVSVAAGDCVIDL